eukprot:TRINITY_DN10142_c0_g1_i3.p1 TRINITY_DN10142_c0_g1~~TRINITY_DN10142_c0_g1_i3.p1  ORF type:complete len:103 (+),score=12.96 TRINITY_DN10142_c0_g1_i3:156-464(+)
MIASGYVANGATVFICSRDVKACDTTAQELTQKGPGKCYGIGLDLGTSKGWNALAETLKTKYEVKKLDVLVNNSGTVWAQPFDTYDEKGWDKVMTLNLKRLG